MVDLQVFTVVFFGEKHLKNKSRVTEQIREQALYLIRQRQFIEFLVGRNSDFDLCAAAAVTRAQKDHRPLNSALVLVLPYVTAEFLYNEETLYDHYTDVRICTKATMEHPKSAVWIRNCDMVDKADLVICYAKEKQSMAWQTMQYAHWAGKRVLNLAGNTDIEKSL